MDPERVPWVCHCPEGLSDDQRVFVGPQDQQPRRPEAVPPSFVMRLLEARRLCASTERPPGGPVVPARLACLLLPVVCLLEARVILGLWTVAVN